MVRRLTHVLAVVVLWAAPVMGNISLFEARFDYDINSPVRITGADLDNDGDHDLIVMVAGVSPVRIMLNNGDGTYAISAEYSSGYSTTRIIPGDFDGDNDTDLVLLGVQDTCRILFNDGSGNFSLVVGAGLPPDMSDGFAADLDGDGDNDLVLESAYWPIINIYLNDGTGEFTYLDVYILSDVAADVFGGDLDGDGDIDLAVADPGIDVVHILLNNGDATFTPSTSISVVDIMAQVEGGDFDGDGDCDLIIDHGNVALMLNNGDATFAAPVDVEPALLSMTACADYDGDGDIDLMGAFWDEDFIYVQFLSNNGNATFSDMAAYPSTPDLSVYGADVDNDGDVDLAMTFRYQDRISLLLNNGDGDFPEAYPYTDQAAGYSLSGSDFDGDGDLDLAGDLPGMYVWHGWWLPGYVVIGLNNGDGTYNAGINSPYTLDDPRDIYGADFDGDGDWDLAVLDDQSKAVRMLNNDGGARFTVADIYNFEPSQNSLSAFSGADLNNDGDCDLVVTTVTGELTDPDSAFILMNNGDGTYTASDPYTMELLPTSVLCADLNDDLYADLVVTCCGLNTDSGYVSVLLNNGDGTFAPPVSIRAGLHPVHAFAADLNGDLIPDLAVSCAGNPDNGYGEYSNLVILIGAGDGTFAPGPGPYLEEYGGVSVGLRNIFGADFDADGDVDLAATLCFGYEWIGPKYETDYNLEGLLVLLNEGDGTYPTVIAYGVNQETYYRSSGCIFGGDVDGDGDIDLVAGNMIFINTTNGGSCTGDSDCDGVPDVADNCLHVDNPNQADADGDGVGDLCDICPGYDDLADTDEDGAPDSCDNCPFTYNPEQDNTDTDADGVPDVCDICAGYDDSIDSDGDGIPDGCDAMCGDANGDRDLNIGDAVHVISYIFKGGAAPDPLCCGDAGGDAVVNIGDAVYLINYIFKGGPPPDVSCCLQPPAKR